MLVLFKGHHSPAIASRLSEALGAAIKPYWGNNTRPGSHRVRGKSSILHYGPRCGADTELKIRGGKKRCYGDAVRLTASGLFCGPRWAHWILFQLITRCRAAAAWKAGDRLWRTRRGSSSRVLYEVGKQLPREDRLQKSTTRCSIPASSYASLGFRAGPICSRAAGFPAQQSYLNKYGDKIDLVSFSVVPVPGGPHGAILCRL